MFLAEYCVRVYFPTWFDIKRNNKLTYGSKNFFNLVQRIIQLSNEEVKHVALQNVQKNAFFAHPENISLAMLGNDNKDVRKQAVSRVQAIREASENLDHNLTSENPKLLDKSDEFNEFNMYDPCVNVGRFEVPKAINTNAKSFFEMVNLDDSDFRQPLAINNLSSKIASVADKSLKFDHPCHNQAVERHVKVVAEASGQVVG